MAKATLKENMQAKKEKPVELHVFTDRKIEHVLTEGEYITLSRKELPEGGMTLLQAGTGMGKSTVVTEQLIYEYDRVILVVPSVIKVQELEQKLPIMPDVMMSFLYGEKKYKDSCGKHDLIVCTYDKFQPSLIRGYNNTLLVIDECHKMYGAGTYRHRALNKLIDQMKNHGSVSHLLTMTATFTPALWGALQLPQMNLLTYTRKKPMQRRLNLVVLQNGDIYKYIECIQECIQSIFVKDDQGHVIGLHKKVFIRLNNKDNASHLADYFKDYFSLKCLVIDSGSKNNDAVKKIFEEQCIPQDVDVVISTSVLDEGININNPDDDIDSVFIIDKTAHPEEILQYLGRLRHANPPCFLLLSNLEDAAFNEDDLDLYHDTCQKKIQAKIKRMHNLVDAFNSVACDILNVKIPVHYQWNYKWYPRNYYYHNVERRAELYQFIEGINCTFMQWLGYDLFEPCKIYGDRSDNSKPDHFAACRVNEAGVAGYAYLLDKSYCYQNLHYFKSRLLQLDPNVLVEISKIDCGKSLAYIRDYFNKKRQNKADDLHARANDEIDRKFGSEAYQQKIRDLINNGGSLKDVDRISPYVEIKEREFSETRTNYSNELYALSEIKMVLEEDKQSKMKQLYEVYSKDMLYQQLAKYFFRYHKDKILADGLKLNPRKAAEYVAMQFQKIKGLPVEKIAKSRGLSGIKFDKDTGEVVVDESKAYCYIRKHFYTEEKNANKPKQRYLLLKGFTYDNYHFRGTHTWYIACETNFQHLRKPVETDRAVYDGFTGEILKIMKYDPVIFGDWDKLPDSVKEEVVKHSSEDAIKLRQMWIEYSTKEKRKNYYKERLWEVSIQMPWVRKRFKRAILEKKWRKNS